MQLEPYFWNPVIQVFQELKEQIDPQVRQIKDDMSKQAKKDLYYYTLELEIANRLSLKLMIEIFIYLEVHHNFNDNSQILRFQKQFYNINFEEITFISVGQNVNQKQKLKQLVQPNMDIYKKINICLEPMVQMYKKLSQDIELLSKEIKDCKDSKNKKVLVNQRYRKNQNIYFIELLIYTLQNLKLIYEAVFHEQNQNSLNNLQEQLSTQIHSQSQFGMYIRTESKGRRDKWFLKIQLFQIICLIFVLRNFGEPNEFSETSHYTFDIENSNIVVSSGLEMKVYGSSPTMYQDLDDTDQIFSYLYLLIALVGFLLLILICLKKNVFQFFSKVDQQKQQISRAKLSQAI